MAKERLSIRTIREILRLKNDHGLTDRQIAKSCSVASYLGRVICSIITRKAIRRGSFRSTKELTEKIDLFVKNHNRNSKPFMWTATAESIFEKLERLCNIISVTKH